MGLTVEQIADKLLVTNKSVSRYLSQINTPCDYCGDIHKNRCFRNTRVYCSRHYQQMRNYGHCFKSIFDTNDYEECEEYYKIYFMDDDRFAVISKESYEIVSEYKWHIRPDGYVEAKNKNQENILLHRLVTNFQYPIVDHINRNKLDNRLGNLRSVTTSQNQINKAIQKNNTSGITGVSWDKDRNKWHVMISVNHVHINLGRFDSLEEAKQVRKNAEKIYHKEYSPIT